MDRELVQSTTTATSEQSATAPYAPPTVEVINLACEISAYAPDGDVPLF